jgi:hypothetical protein
VRTASLARTKPSRFRIGSTRKPYDVLQLAERDRTNRAAIDPRGDYRGEESTIEARIAAAKRPCADNRIE